MLKAVELGYVPCFRIALSQQPIQPVDIQGIQTARAFFHLQRWDECCKVLDYCMQRSEKIYETFLKLREDIMIKNEEINQKNEEITEKSKR